MSFIFLVFLNGFQFQEATLRSIAFFLFDDLYPFLLCFIDDLIHELVEWNSHKVLVVSLAQIDVLLPAFVVVYEGKSTS